ncbi:hypothetical protein [Kordia jejudonensis]|uniref:hypothetical protein n=1 Tax=Kordia jejudonensis TaxID=1348245 RepID=UPI0012E00C8E|nr:hypothetical protein [Kordia jejudonensis]
MKKRILKPLRLNKKQITNFQTKLITGGNTAYYECASIYCWEQPNTGVVTCPTITCNC